MSADICVLCNGKSFDAQPVRYVFKETTYNLTKCRNCGLFTVDPRPSPAEVKDFYCQEYFEKDYSCGIKGDSYYEEEERTQKKAREALQLILAHKTTGKFLEVGCAGGVFLREAQKLGFTVSGIEISKVIAEEARRKLGLSVKIGDFEIYPFGDEKFDVICMFDVFEHLINPLLVLRKVKDLLQPGGILFIDIPTSKNALPFRLSSLVLKRLNKTRTVHSPPYHVFEYTSDTLRKLMTETGLKVLLEKRSATPPWLFEDDYPGWLGNAMLGACRNANYFLPVLNRLFSDRLILLASKEATKR